MMLFGSLDHLRITRARSEETPRLTSDNQPGMRRTSTLGWLRSWTSTGVDLEVLASPSWRRFESGPPRQPKNSQR